MCWLQSSSQSGRRQSGRRQSGRRRLAGWLVGWLAGWMGGTLLAGQLAGWMGRPLVRSMVGWLGRLMAWPRLGRLMACPLARRLARGLFAVGDGELFAVGDDHHRHSRTRRSRRRGRIHACRTRQATSVPRRGASAR